VMGNQLLVLTFSSFFLLTTTVRRQRIAMYISLFTLAIAVNYTTNSGKDLKLLRVSLPLIYNSFILFQSPLRIADAVRSLAHTTKNLICSFATFLKFSKQREMNRLFELSAKFLTEDVGGAGIGLV
jgi:hypothetical protein